MKDILRQNVFRLVSRELVLALGVRQHRWNSVVKLNSYESFDLSESITISIIKSC
jgi:hypothetical protein